MTTQVERATRRAGHSVATRAFGVFYLAMALGVNTFLTFPRAAETMVGFERDSWIPMYQDLLGAVAVPNADVVVLATIVFETAIGTATLVGSQRVQSWAMLTATAWCVALLPALTWPYLAPMPLLIAAQLWLGLRIRSKEV